MRRSGVLPALLAVFLAAIPAGAQEQETTSRLVRMATGSMAGVYYPVGVALCRLVNEDRRAHGLRCAAEPSEGSLQNTELLRSGDVQFAIIQSDIQAAAYEGTGGETPFQALRSVMALHPEPLTVVVRADSAIAGLDELPGKRISVGPAGSGQRAIWDVVMAAENWTQASFGALLDLAPTDQAAALCDGRIDAFITSIGHPATTVQEATLSCDARIVPVEGAGIDRLVARTPSYFETTIPAYLYRGNSGTVRSFGVGAALVTRADVPDDVVRILAASALSKLPRLRGLDPALAELDAAAMAEDGLVAPLHPGAAQAFEAAGPLGN